MKTTLPAIGLAALALVGLTPAATAAPSVPRKTFHFGLAGSGDCHQDNTYLVVNQNGVAGFSTTTWTDHTHSGDTWHATFLLETDGGTILVTSPTFDSPRMDDGNPPPRYYWHASFSFDPNLYFSITQAAERASC